MKAPSVKPVRCAIYTRYPPSRGWTRSSTRWMRNTRQPPQGKGTKRARGKDNEGHKN
jgi:hypothetical protein